MLARVPYPEALENTERIARLCRAFAFPVGRLHPPSLQPPAQASAKLRRLSFGEAARRYRPLPLHYLRRLDQELTVIDQMNLADFFLLVRQVVDFARERGIRHSVRGSAAGSLVVYLLLGGVDPVAHNLLFERFVNEGRSDMPDIDLDFDSDRRDEVIRRLMDLFPRQTAMVSTIHTFRVRSAVRLVARALGYPLGEIDRLATCLPWSLRGRDLNEALTNLPELRDAPIQHETRLIELAARLTGLPFQSSVHLGGVIIAPEDIKAWTPVGVSPKGIPVGQLDKDDVDALGLLKLDILGLRMHTAIRKALEILQRKGILLDLDRTPLNDRKTYALLRSTESVGIFQLESPGQRHLLGRLQPRRFKDLIAEISLFRPGPVEGNMVETFVKRRNHEEPVRILHDDSLLVATGIGVWGNNSPVGWAFDITNFVFWIGIGHAGTLISAILFLFRQKWRTEHQPLRRGHDHLRGRSARASSRRFTWAGCGSIYWLAPYPNQMSLWPNFRSPLLWDVFAVSTYGTVSLLFWYLGMIPDLATLRDRATTPLAPVRSTACLPWAGAARPASGTSTNGPICCWPRWPRRWC